VQRLQCVFNNLHKPINDNVQDQHAKYRTQSTTNPEIKESTVNTNNTGSSELADTAITDSTEIFSRYTGHISHLNVLDRDIHIVENDPSR
jgi:plasmid rolling circle replication initiator protein Rep